jgi:hypothetical protein
MINFMCDKQVVLEIIEYQGRYYNEEYTNYQYNDIKKYVAEQEDSFVYESFMHSVVEKFYSNKLNASANEFITPFQLRMRKYKKGKDWKLI